MSDKRSRVAGKQRRSDLAGLAVIVAVCLGVAGLGGAMTSSSVTTWYPTLVKPPFNPPDWVFAPVWTMLYVFMAVAAWRVWRCRPDDRRHVALGWFTAQLVLNLLWSGIFFGLNRIGVALLEIVLLWVAIAATSRYFARIDRIAAWLLMPYLAWVSFAMVLNAAIWWLN